MIKIKDFLNENRNITKYLDFLKIENNISLLELENTKIFNLIIENSLYSSVFEQRVHENVCQMLNESFGREKDVILEIDDTFFSESIIQKTLFILNESGSLPDVEPVPRELSEPIVSDFATKVLERLKVVRIETIAGLGSTRAMLKNLPNAKAFGGDIDLIAVSNTNNRDAAKKLGEWAKSKGFDFQIAFGNIFSVAYPYKGKKYQIDLMLANPSKDDAVYNYMRKFKYFSDEDPNQTGAFILKGAHRSELAKTMVKAVGLSAAESGFKQFIWDNSFSNISELVSKLEGKAKRFRDPVKKQQTMDLSAILTARIRTLGKLKDELTENGILKDRYPNIMFKDVPKGFEVMLDLLFKKADTELQWEKILDKKFGITDIISKMKSFDNVLDIVKLLKQRRIITPRAVVFIFNEIKAAFDKGKAAGSWSPELEQYIEKKLPELKNRWN